MTKETKLSDHYDDYQDDDDEFGEDDEMYSNQLYQEEDTLSSRKVEITLTLKTSEKAAKITAWVSNNIEYEKIIFIAAGVETPIDLTTIGYDTNVVLEQFLQRLTIDINFINVIQKYNNIEKNQTKSQFLDTLGTFVTLSKISN